MSFYGSIDTATVDSRYPFLNELGAHIIVIDEWFGRKTRKGPFGDFCNLTVVKTLAGDASAVGQMRCRLRTEDADGMWAKEAKERGITAMTAAARSIPGNEDYVYPPKDFTGDVLKNIHDKNGANVAGFPLKIQVSTNKTKAGKDFTAVTYSIPTKRDLEGVTLDESGRVVK